MGSCVYPGLRRPVVAGRMGQMAPLVCYPSRFRKRLSRSYVRARRICRGLRGGMIADGGGVQNGWTVGSRK